MKVVFENGISFFGEESGACKTAVLEAVFNTSPVGYQEIISDPSYFGQIVFMTYPLIGNYGINSFDYESESPCVGALAVGEMADCYSNYQSIISLSKKLIENDIPAISGIDTRQIVRMISFYGSMRVMITPDDNLSTKSCLEIINNTPIFKNHVSKLKKFKDIKKIDFNILGNFNKKYSNNQNDQKKVLVIDCGVKYGILRALLKKNCQVYVAPYDITTEQVLNFKPDGIVVSNGPGNPEENETVVNLIKQIQGKFPIFGICLGHQIIALANGAKTYKMKFGHRGSNHPVKNLENGKIEITSQNHSYAVDAASLSNTDLTLTHINLLDNTAEGIEIKLKNIFSVQYHPESFPGPQDSFYLFDKFINMFKV
ncbi:MAG: glutamine-hydrolyzing carbamoyl-phosphate synthase small subunit [Oscillospiraceae bacterium]|jgi:carbamoyl-phosphate synthase small subunit|nr:glutamine-hydrolyzing carbamoyl-phosphate synthase small subunit [Oscillospiraceae bacterium]